MTPPASKVLRVFFRHDKRLHGEISRLVYRLVRDFTTAAAGKRIRTGAVLVFQTSGQFARWNPHWHGLFLEGGFDPDGRFVHVPTVDLANMSACFRQRVIAFFLERKFLNERLAKNMVQWAHSGFSVDGSVRVPAGSAKAREALSQYIVRPPVSLQKLLVDEGGADTVVYRAPFNDYFGTDTKVFPATEFLVEVLQHLPEPRSRLVRSYGLYSSRARGTWSRTPQLVRLAPEGWKRDHPPEPSLRIGLPDEQQSDCSVSAKQSRAALRSADQEGLRGGSPELPSLSQTHEGHRRPQAGAQDPPASHQQGKAAARSGSRLPQLIASLRPRGG